MMLTIDPRIRFYLDENISERLIDPLRLLDYDRISANQLGNTDLVDPRHPLVAANLHRVFITFNVNDFSILHEAWTGWWHPWGLVSEPRHSGILLIPAAKRLEMETIAGAVHQLVEREQTFVNRLFSWRRTTGWLEHVVR